MIKASLTEKQLIDFNNDGFLTVDNFIELQYLEDLKTRINLLFKGTLKLVLSQMSGIGGKKETQAMLHDKFVMLGNPIAL